MKSGDSSSKAAAVRKTLSQIPRGSTRTKMEVFRKTLQHLKRGDEAINTGTRTVLGSELKELTEKGATGWHRVVSSDGGLLSRRGAKQLKLLKADGSRPKENEDIVSWAKRRRAKYVGCYRPTATKNGAHPQRLCVKVRDLASTKAKAKANKEEGLDEGQKLIRSLRSKWNGKSHRWSLEFIKSDKELKERRRLSGGKHFWLVGEEHPEPPEFEPEGAAKATTTSSGTKRPRSSSSEKPTVAVGKSGDKVARALTSAKWKRLQQKGIVRLGKALTDNQCQDLLRVAQKGDFEETVNLAGEAGHSGRYCFCKTTPKVVDAVRKQLFEKLVQFSPELKEAYGSNLAALESKCKKAGQAKPANIFLAYGEGGENLAHQDPYGKIFFPYQATVMLSRRGRDFKGGELFVKGSNGQTEQVSPTRGDVVLFAANRFAVNGTDFKHGVRPVKRARANAPCKRFALGIVFNLR